MTHALVRQYPYGKTRRESKGFPLLATHLIAIFSIIWFSISKQHITIHLHSQSYGSGLLLPAIIQYFFWNNVTDIAVKKRWLMFVIFADAHRLYTYGKHIFTADEEIGFSNLLYHSIYVSFFLLHLFGIAYYNGRGKILWKGI